jgi:hypothetical protein
MQSIRVEEWHGQAFLIVVSGKTGGQRVWSIAASIGAGMLDTTMKIARSLPRAIKVWVKAAVPPWIT